jgi:uncharacterized membrane protein
MEEAIRDALDVLIPIVEALGAAVVFAGALHAFGLFVAAQLRLVRLGFDAIRLRLARYLALGLEFQLGADILSTAVSPSYEELGKLGAVAAIRTALQFFLARELAAAGDDVEASTDMDTSGPSGAPR